MGQHKTAPADPDDQADAPAPVEADADRALDDRPVYRVLATPTCQGIRINSRDYKPGARTRLLDADDAAWLVAAGYVELVEADDDRALDGDDDNEGG